ncbi:hypothetical protein [Hydrocoleum sp. CS-953]|nr:hypothetical protein [Hydrocoleum sp. CS-953]
MEKNSIYLYLWKALKDENFSGIAVLPLEKIPEYLIAFEQGNMEL